MIPLLHDEDGTGEAPQGVRPVCRLREWVDCPVGCVKGL